MYIFLNDLWCLYISDKIPYHPSWPWNHSLCPNDDLVIPSLLPPFPKSWDSRSLPPCLTWSVIGYVFQTLVSEIILQSTAYRHTEPCMKFLSFGVISKLDSKFLGVIDQAQSASETLLEKPNRTFILLLGLKLCYLDF